MEANMSVKVMNENEVMELMGMTPQEACEALDAFKKEMQREETELMTELNDAVEVLRSMRADEEREIISNEEIREAVAIREQCETEPAQPLDINVPFFHLDEVGFTFVEGSFVCKTGKVLHGLFLIDSGSHANVFNHEALHALDESWFEEDTWVLTGIDNKGETCQRVKLNINVGGIQSEEDFNIAKQIDWTTCFGKNTIIGLLGSQYLADHDLVLDFSTRSLHTSELTELDYSGIDFAFPMGFGFHFYGIPLVGFEKDGQEFICVADSGANMSLLTQYAMEQGADNYTHDENASSQIVGVGTCAETTQATITMSLISLGKEEGETVTLEDREEFQILGGREYLASSNDESAPVISGLLSTPFMLKRKWVLDYKLGVIYAKVA